MKRHVILLIAFTLFAWGSVVQARSDSEGGQHGKSIEVVLQEIRESQGISKNDRIDCQKVSDQQLEELGEAFMSVMHPDPEEHEIMDRMMGGEGSPMLSTMHRIMGARYLGCYGGTMGGMMGRNIMANYPYGRWGDHSAMMGYGYGGFLLWIIFFILLGIIIYLVMRSARVKEHLVSPRETPLEILRRRYAQGEITKDELEAMKKDLQQ